MPTAEDRPVVIVGMMGSGKSTVGAALARSLGRPFVDTDAVVESAVGMSVAEVFATRGERAFRDAERDAVDAAVVGKVVVAVGGGAVLAEANRARLRMATVVWLRAEPATLADRVDDGAGRPLLGSSGADTLRALDASRRPLYTEVADITVDVDDSTVDEAVESVSAAVRSIWESTCNR